MVSAAGTTVIAYTFDLHDFDRPEDIRRAAESFHDSGIAATFFIPSAMLDEARYAEPIRRLPRLGHEVGSHSHLHDWREVDALMRGGAEDVTFLSLSHRRHCEFFGARPTSFRSPRWCTLGPAAVRELVRLGYVADSSATPQRFPLFSSNPYHPGWWSSPRRLHTLAPGLIEVPTSTLLLPAGAPSFLTLRGTGSRVLLGLLEFEARLDRNHPIVLQFHVGDFLADGRREPEAERFSWSHLRLRSQGGFPFKHFFRDRDPLRVARNHRAIVRRFAHLPCSTITSIACGFLEAREATSSDTRALGAPRRAPRSRALVRPREETLV